MQLAIYTLQPNSIQAAIYTLQYRLPMPSVCSAICDSDSAIVDSFRYRLPRPLVCSAISDSFLHRLPSFRFLPLQAAKLHATYDEMSTLFDALDEDGSGGLELREIQPLVNKLKQAADRANAEINRFEKEAVLRA